MCKKVAPTPLLTLRLFKDRTVMAGCMLGLFYFSKSIPNSLPQKKVNSNCQLREIVAYYLSLQPYFYSYLQVARNTNSVAAGRITLVRHPSPKPFPS